MVGQCRAALHRTRPPVNVKMPVTPVRTPASPGELEILARCTALSHVLQRAPSRGPVLPTYRSADRWTALVPAVVQIALSAGVFAATSPPRQVRLIVCAPGTCKHSEKVAEGVRMRYTSVTDLCQGRTVEILNRSEVLYTSAAHGRCKQSNPTICNAESKKEKSSPSVTASPSLLHASFPRRQSLPRNTCPWACMSAAYREVRAVT